MYSTHVLQSLMGFAFVGLQQTFAISVPHHPPHLMARQVGNSTVSRSPCPGLNTLANEGILPQDGRGLTLQMLQDAMVSTYNFDIPLALGFASSAFIFCGKPGFNTIDLEDLNLHNGIEHDASMTRNDTIQGDNHTVDPGLLQALLDDADGDFVTADSLAKTRVRRDQESLADGGVTMDLVHSAFAYGEPAVLLQTLAKLGGDPSALQAPKTAVKQWLGEERFPDGWQKPDQITVINNRALAGVIRLKAAKLNGGSPVW